MLKDNYSEDFKKQILERWVVMKRQETKDKYEEFSLFVKMIDYLKRQKLESKIRILKMFTGTKLPYEIMQRINKFKVELERIDSAKEYFAYMYINHNKNLVHNIYPGIQSTYNSCACCRENGIIGKIVNGTEFCRNFHSVFICQQCITNNSPKKRHSMCSNRWIDKNNELVVLQGHIQLFKSNHFRDDVLVHKVKLQEELGFIEKVTS
jgi:hypothetical protein